MNHRVLSAAVLATALSSLSLSAQDKAVSFETQVLPILEKNCVECHRTEYVDENGKKVRPKGGLVLDTKTGIMAGRKKKPVIVAGKPESSELYEVVTLADDDEDRMPPKDKKAALSAADKETLKNWIAGGTELEKMFGAWEGKPSGGVKKSEEKKEAAGEKKGATDRKGDGQRPARDKGDGGTPGGDKKFGDKPAGPSPGGGKPSGDKPSGDKPSGTPPAGGRGE